jgi:hypothetical protein
MSVLSVIIWGTKRTLNKLGYVADFCPLCRQSRAFSVSRVGKVGHFYYNTVKSALQKDGWTITHDPFPLKVGKKRLSVDLGAERLLSAEKGTQRIVVEVKSFVGESDVKDLEQALGQYILYRQILNEMGSDRHLYLAVSCLTFNSVFTIELGQILLKNQIVKLIVFDDETEAIVQWIPH